MKIMNRLVHNFDFEIFVPYVLLSIFGCLMIFSASSINLTYVSVNDSSYMVRQLMYVTGGIGLFFAAGLVNLSFFRSANVLLGFMLLVFLGLVLVLAVGDTINGAKAWLSLGPVNIQPSEFLKLFFILYFSNYFDGAIPYFMKKKTLKHWRFTVIMTLLMLFLLIKEPDYGGLLIDLAIIFMMLMSFLAGISRKNELLVEGSVFLVIPSVVTIVLVGMKKLNYAHLQIPFLKNYVLKRFEGFAQPFKYVASSGKQLVNSYIALGNGGLLGLGLGNSIQKRGYLPEPYTDFILSVIAEEVGILGVLFVLICLAFLIIRTIIIGARAGTVYERLVCYGIATLMLIQASLNIGAVCGLLPITGVTLPFVSYGGSSMLMLSTCLGIVFNISGRQKAHKQRKKMLNKNHN